MPVWDTPPGTIPLEIVHLHPGYASFSPEDLMAADSQGVAISVINEGGWFHDERILKYEPYDQSFESSLGNRDVKRLEDEHGLAKRGRDAKYSYRCTKCGATR